MFFFSLPVLHSWSIKMALLQLKALTFFLFLLMFYVIYTAFWHALKVTRWSFFGSDILKHGASSVTEGQCVYSLLKKHPFTGLQKNQLQLYFKGVLVVALHFLSILAALFQCEGVFFALLLPVATYFNSQVLNWGCPLIFSTISLN